MPPCARTSDLLRLRAANARSARRTRSPRGKTGPSAQPDEAASVGVRRSPGEPTVQRRGSSIADRVLIADTALDRRQTGLGDPDHAAHRVAPIETAVRRRSCRWDVRAGGLCRTAATSDARDMRQVNRLRRLLSRAGHEYADGDRPTRTMTSRLTGAAANPSRRGHRQPGRRRRFSPRRRRARPGGTGLQRECRGHTCANPPSTNNSRPVT